MPGASKGRLLAAWIDLIADGSSRELFLEDGETFDLNAEGKFKICKM